MVINLAAGLDARPYRMPLPPSLQWIEVDLPELLAYKEEILAGKTPACALERVRLDLADGSARRDLFENGWNPKDVRSMFQTAARMKRVPFLMRLLAMLPESQGRQGSRPWSGICLLEKTFSGDVRP